MELKIYDTLTRDKRTFVPLDRERVRMYVCWPTVYDFAHIGNARPLIVFDVLYRLLRHVYGAASSPKRPTGTSRTTLRRSAACRRPSSRVRPSTSTR